MTPLPLERTTITVRLDGIQAEIAELQRLAKTPRATFIHGTGHKLAAYHLHRALEGIFNISNHVLARFPGGGIESYKGMAIALGAHGIVTKSFAKNALYQMAGYRNRLVHFYAEVTPEELYRVITRNLRDFDLFCTAIKKLLKNPKRWQLTIE